MELRGISVEVYYRETERLCKNYINKIDRILSCAEVDEEKITPERASVISAHAGEIASRLGEGRERLCDELLKRKKELDAIAVESNEAEGGEDEEYKLCIEALSYLEKPIYEVGFDVELLERIRQAEPFELDTMVGALRAPRQLGICLKRKFYHIPASYIEEYAIPKYIAIYQSERIFGSEVAGVRYYGEVKKCTPMRRSKIREIPKKSNELYYKFKVKSWIRLENPIAPKELGFIRLFTNSFLLLNAEEIPELTLTAPNDFVFYRLLKTAIKEIRENKNRIFAGFSLGELDFAVSASEIYLCKGGRLFDAFSVSSFMQTPSLIFDDIKRALSKALKNKQA